MTLKELEEIKERVMFATADAYIAFDTMRLVIGRRKFVINPSEEMIGGLTRSAWEERYAVQKTVMKHDAMRLVRELEMRIKA